MLIYLGLKAETPQPIIEGVANARAKLETHFLTGSPVKSPCFSLWDVDGEGTWLKNNLDIQGKLWYKYSIRWTRIVSVTAW